MVGGILFESWLIEVFIFISHRTQPFMTEHLLVKPPKDWFRQNVRELTMRNFRWKKNSSH